MEPKDVLAVEYSHVGENPSRGILRLISILTIVFGAALVGTVVAQFFYLQSVKVVQSRIDLAMSAGNALGGGLLIAGGAFSLNGGFRRLFLTTLAVAICLSVIEATISAVTLTIQQRGSPLPQPWLLVVMSIMYLIVMMMFPLAAFLIVRKCK